MTKFNDEISRARQIVDLLDENDPDKLEILENETDIFKLIEWAMRKDKELDSWIGALKDLIATYSDRKKALEARKERMRELLTTMMQDINETSYKGVHGTVTLKAQPQKPIVDDVELLPAHCVKIKKSPDMAAIKQAIENGETLTGIHMSNGGQSLTIRRK